jgi:hypothetical protein
VCKYTPPRGDDSPLRISVLVLGQHVHDDEYNHTDNKPGCWMKFAIVGAGRMTVDCYCLRHGYDGGNTGRALRNWQLQASNDGAEWTTRRAHANDEALAKAAFSTASWAVEGGKQRYVNPVDSNAVTVTASEGGGSLFAAGRFVQHQSDGQTNRTADEPNSWMAVALGGGAQAKVTRYCLRHGNNNSYYALRNWDLEASTDGRAWTTLRSHRNDESLAKTGFSTAGWAVEGGKGAFSHFRIRQTGKTACGDNDYSLACAGIELYGELLPPAAPV